MSEGSDDNDEDLIEVRLGRPSDSNDDDDEDSTNDEDSDDVSNTHKTFQYSKQMKISLKTTAVYTQIMMMMVMMKEK